MQTRGKALWPSIFLILQLQSLNTEASQMHTHLTNIVAEIEMFRSIFNVNSFSASYEEISIGFQGMKNCVNKFAFF
jgi:hypothetical protein